MPEILEVEAARKVLAACALDREIVKVHAPDTWFMKRGTTAPALRHALVGNAFTAARRRGKQIVLDTRDPDVHLGLHLGMSGRVLVDDQEAGDPLLYASNRRTPKWHRFGVHFADGGDFMLRDPRRLGAVELDPDESRLGPDAMTLSYKELDHALGSAHRADQGGAHGPAPHRRPRQPARRRSRCGGPGIDPSRAPADIDAEHRKILHKAIRTDAAHARPAGRLAHRRHAPGPRRPVPRDGAPLRRGTVGGRTTYWCPVHQH